MAHYIDKTALVAEIDALQEATMDKNRNFLSSYDEGKFDALTALEYFLDTLEVKEVDLDKYYHDFLQKEWFDKDCNRTISEMMAFTAKHFFELGLKAQKGE